MIEFNDLGYGVELRLRDRSVFFQGEDADIVREEEHEIDKIWSRLFYNQHGSHCRKQFGPFQSYEEHLTACFSRYF